MKPLRSKLIRLAHEKPELREHLLPLLKSAGAPVARKFSDEEILSAAEDVAKKDPKKRFSAMEIRRTLAERDGTDYVQMEGPSLEKRLEALVKLKKIVPAASRGLYQFVAETKGEGIEFRNAGGNTIEILLNGAEVGTITRGDGEFIGSSRQREKIFTIHLESEDQAFTGKNSPPDFPKLTDAKAWVRKALT